MFGDAKEVEWQGGSKIGEKVAQAGRIVRVVVVGVERPPRECVPHGGVRVVLTIVEL